MGIAKHRRWIEADTSVPEQRQPEGVVDTSLLYEELRRKFVHEGTPVEVDFRRLVHWLRIGDQLTHQIHPYPAKLLPHIAHFLVRSNRLQRGDVVLDPFCGSGTVALEAALAGCQPYVADANPFALLITQVKNTPYDVKVLREICTAAVARARRLKTAPKVDVVNEELWYSKEHKRTLEIILRAVREVGDDDARRFLEVCFSVVARRLSLADPTISVPVRLRIKPSMSAARNRAVRERLKWIQESSPLDEFERAVETNISRVVEANNERPDRAAAVVVGRDARALQSPLLDGRPLPTGSVHMVLTSPPYGSAQKYVRASGLALNWLGFATPTELKELEATSIGREHLPRHLENMGARALGAQLPDQYEELISRVAEKNELRARITRTYLIEMAAAVAEAGRVTRSGGAVALVIGNNLVSGEVVRNDEFLVACGAQHGLDLELSLVDHIKSRGLMTKRNRTASVISRESVLVLRKRG